MQLSLTNFSGFGRWEGRWAGVELDHPLPCERVWGSSAAGDPAAALDPVSPPRGRSGRLKGVTLPAPGSPVGGGPRGGPPESPNVRVKPSIAGGAAAPGAPTAHLIPIANRVYQPAQTPT